MRFEIQDSKQVRILNGWNTWSILYESLFIYKVKLYLICTLYLIRSESTAHLGVVHIKNHNLKLHWHFFDDNRNMCKNNDIKSSFFMISCFKPHIDLLLYEYKPIHLMGRVSTECAEKVYLKSTTGTFFQFNKKVIERTDKIEYNLITNTAASTSMIFIVKCSWKSCSNKYIFKNKYITILIVITKSLIVHTYIRKSIFG